MEFITSLFFTLMLFLIGTSLFWRFNLASPLNSIRLGRLHYLLLGILLGIFFPEDDYLFRKLDHLRFGLMGVLLVWFGFREGTDFDLQNFQQAPASHIGYRIVQLLIVFVLVILVAFAATPLLKTYIGLQNHLPLVFLFLGCFALTAMAGPRLTTGTYSHLTGTLSLPFLNNTTSLFLLGLLTPIFGSPVIQMGPFSFVSYTHIGLVVFALGLISGIAFDFIFRAYRNGYECIFLTVATMVTIGGFCTYLKTPGLFIGFFAGAWLINTTARKRQVLELTDRTSAVLEPAFFILAGSIIGGFGGSPFFKGTMPFMLAFAMLFIRVFAHLAAQFIGNQLFKQDQSPKASFFENWTPLGNLGVALSIQLLFLPVEFEHNALSAGTLLAVILSQVLWKAPAPKPFSSQTIAVE